MVMKSAGDKVVVVDDDPEIINSILRVLSRGGFQAYGASDGEQGFEVFNQLRPTVVLTDLVMPRVSGFELLEKIKQISPITQVVVISGLGTTEDVIKALRLGATDFLTKPINAELLSHTVRRCVERHDLILERIGRKETLEREVRERTAALTETFYGTVKALGLLTEKRDPYTAGHQQRVALLAMGIGRSLGLAHRELEALHVAGLLHDIGKVAVPVELLVKPATLTPPEADLMKEHPQAGYEIVKDIPFTQSLGKDVSIIVLQHHERLDGSGYPKGLRNREIELESCILSVSDVVEAMSSHRPYRAARDMEATKTEIINGRGTLYASEPVDACLRLMEEHRHNISTLFDSLAEAAEQH